MLDLKHAYLFTRVVDRGGFDLAVPSATGTCDCQVECVSLKILLECNYFTARPEGLP